MITGDYVLVYGLRSQQPFEREVHVLLIDVKEQRCVLFDAGVDQVRPSPCAYQ